jgi:hypothetical protein
MPLGNTALTSAGLTILVATVVAALLLVAAVTRPGRADAA